MSYALLRRDISLLLLDEGNEEICLDPSKLMKDGLTPCL